MDSLIAAASRALAAGDALGALKRVALRDDPPALALLGRLDDAATALAPLELHAVPPALAAVAELTLAELALRSLRVAPARAALERARAYAGRAEVPALLAEVEEAHAAFERPAARRIAAGVAQT